ncbi:type I-C CRISPR-associated endonuclease Cas1c [Lagierella sp.]|uniref:type I-C CRISPR-associated endonuclease Cas1c n=1 Tax=Lagierella sp. TaxID=2849657 RepID=UPI002618A4D5|nr:type I-C CRISPR-associated endonuclease Cas1c [Lagierella sp.]
MKKLLNVLYVTREDAYLAKEGENIVIKEYGKVIGRFPIHILEGIICFNYQGASPDLIKMCGDNNIIIAFMTPQGRYCGRYIGKSSGNVLVRREQYRLADGEESLEFVRNIVYAKGYNSKKIIKSFVKDHKEIVDLQRIDKSIALIDKALDDIKISQDKDSLRGLEGVVAKAYFDIFDEMILQQREDFYFVGRNRRPPRDRVNTLLSFLYTVLTYDCQSALEAEGIDSYVGFMHVDRPGRISMALDLCEEMRSYLVDRLCLSLINLRIIKPVDFEIKENEAVLLNDKGKQKVIKAWQENKNREIKHPFIGEKIKLGLLPHVQARLLNRYLRGDLESYPPFVIRGN